MAPSCKFHYHIETPHGVDQFGSLVVCFPCKYEGKSAITLCFHQPSSSSSIADHFSAWTANFDAPAGGALRVKHRGRVMDFDWSHEDTSVNSIQWVTFYRDCDHKIIEVTKGHRNILTYNLYASPSANLAQPVSGREQLALYDIVRNIVHESKFMPEGTFDGLTHSDLDDLISYTGGHFGFFCNHGYAHAPKTGRRSQGSRSRRLLSLPQSQPERHHSSYYRTPKNRHHGRYICKVIDAVSSLRTHL